MARLTYQVEERGFATPCWTWLGYKNEAGYGKVSHEGRWCRAHRVSYVEKYGPTDSDLDHLCRNRDCINPDHLEPVTNAENQRRGAKAKLMMEKAQEIRDLYPIFTQVQLAERYGVARRTIRQVLAGTTWNG